MSAPYPEVGKDLGTAYSTRAVKKKVKYRIARVVTRPGNIPTAEGEIIVVCEGEDGSIRVITEAAWKQNAKPDGSYPLPCVAHLQACVENPYPFSSPSTAAIAPWRNCPLCVEAVR